MKGFRVSICRRDTDFVVVPMNGGGGLYFAVQPIVCVARTLDELTRALESAIAISDVTLGVVNLRDYKDPVPKAVGLKSTRKFETTVRALCEAFRSKGDITVTLYRHAHDGRGFEPTDRVVELAASAAAKEIAQTTIELMRETSV